MKLFTIGFTQKSAEAFFGTLSDSRVQLLIDIRLRPGGQLAGFAKQRDLPYFLAHLANNCGYFHMPDLAPTASILKEYRESGNWQEYVARFEALMNERKIPQTLNRGVFANQICCLLCSEALPDQCHRRLVAERIANHWQGVEVIHL